MIYRLVIEHKASYGSRRIQSTLCSWYET